MSRSSNAAATAAGLSGRSVTLAGAELCAALEAESSKRTEATGAVTLATDPPGARLATTTLSVTVEESTTAGALAAVTAFVATCVAVAYVGMTAQSAEY
jgi:hypothetical protein